MTFADDVLEIGRQPLNAVELQLDHCSRRYGESPCAATQALQNGVAHSGDLSNAAWTKLFSTIDSAVVSGPDVSTTLDRIVPTVTSTPFHQIQQVSPSADTDGETQFTAACHFARDTLQDNGQDYTQIELSLAFSGTVIDTVRFDLSSGASRLVTDSADTVQFGVIAMTDTGGTRQLFRVWLACERAITTGSVQAIARAVDPALDFDTAAGAYAGNALDGVIAGCLSIRVGINPGKYADTTASTIALPSGGSPTGLCYNTFATCQDTANYDKTTKNLLLIDGVAQNWNLPGYPIVRDISYAATKIEPGRGLSSRGKVTVTVQDFPHNGFDGINTGSTNDADPYAELRRIPIASADDFSDADGESRGTFFGKFRPRNLYYVGRPMILREAYIGTDGAISSSRDRQYVLDEISGPDAQGWVRLIGKDVLSFASDDRAEAPFPALSAWVLAATLTESLGTDPEMASTAIAQAVWDEADARGGGANKHIRVGGEIMLLGTRPVDEFIPVTRAQGGTALDEHNTDATVQPCLTYTAHSVELIVQELLETFAEVPAQYITVADWTTEKTDHLTNYDLTTIISEPTGVQSLLNEITELALIDLWYDDLAAQIRFKVQSPYQQTPIPMLSDSDNVLADSLTIDDVPKRRLSRVLVWYGIINYAEDLTEASNYARGSFEIAADKEGENQYNQIQTRTIYNRWQVEADDTEVALTSNRLITRYGTVPKQATFMVDASVSDTLATGDVFDLTTRQLQDADGNRQTVRMQVIEMQPQSGGTLYRIKAFAYFGDPFSEGPLTISSDRTDLDLFIELNGPGSPITKEIIIDTGTTIDATVGNAAISAGDLPPGSDITLTVKGNIYGHAGPGGQGGLGNYRSVYEPEPPAQCIVSSRGEDGSYGGDGGDAIVCTAANAITLHVTAISGAKIYGGGGGGAGGKGFATTGTSGSVTGGGGGGSGQGADAQAGAGGNTSLLIECGAPTDRGGAAGTAGSTSAAGTGAAAQFGATAGGNGGAWAVVGSDSPSESTPGGAAGYAIRYNGSTPDEDFQAGSDIKGATT